MESSRLYLLARTSQVFFLFYTSCSWECRFPFFFGHIRKPIIKSNSGSRSLLQFYYLPLIFSLRFLSVFNFFFLFIYLQSFVSVPSLYSSILFFLSLFRRLLIWRINESVLYSCVFRRNKHPAVPRLVNLNVICPSGGPRNNIFDYRSLKTAGY